MQTQKHGVMQKSKYVYCKIMQRLKKKKKRKPGCLVGIREKLKLPLLELALVFSSFYLQSGMQVPGRYSTASSFCFYTSNQLQQLSLTLTLKRAFCHPMQIFADSSAAPPSSIILLFVIFQQMTTNPTIYLPRKRLKR